MEILMKLKCQSGESGKTTPTLSTIKIIDHHQQMKQHSTKQMIASPPLNLNQTKPLTLINHHPQNMSTAMIQEIITQGPSGPSTTNAPMDCCAGASSACTSLCYENSPSCCRPTISSPHTSTPPLCCNGARSIPPPPLVLCSTQTPAVPVLSASQKPCGPPPLAPVNSSTTSSIYSNATYDLNSLKQEHNPHHYEYQEPQEDFVSIDDVKVKNFLMNMGNNNQKQSPPPASIISEDNHFKQERLKHEDRVNETVVKVNQEEDDKTSLKLENGLPEVKTQLAPRLIIRTNPPYVRTLPRSSSPPALAPINGVSAEKLLQHNNPAKPAIVFKIIQVSEKQLSQQRTLKVISSNSSPANNNNNQSNNNIGEASQQNFSRPVKRVHPIPNGLNESEQQNHYSRPSSASNSSPPLSNELQKPSKDNSKHRIVANIDLLESSDEEEYFDKTEQSYADEDEDDEDDLPLAASAVSCQLDCDDDDDVADSKSFAKRPRLSDLPNSEDDELLGLPSDDDFDPEDEDGVELKWDELSSKPAVPQQQMLPQLLQQKPQIKSTQNHHQVYQQKPYYSPPQHHQQQMAPKPQSYHSSPPQHHSSQSPSLLQVQSNVPYRENYREKEIQAHECHVCGKVVQSNYNLRRHMMIHTGERPFACDLCERRFREFSDLKKHRRRHVNEIGYICLICHMNRPTPNDSTRCHACEYKQVPPKFFAEKPGRSSPPSNGSISANENVKRDHYSNSGLPILQKRPMPPSQHSTSPLLTGQKLSLPPSTTIVATNNVYTPPPLKKALTIPVPPLAPLIKNTSCAISEKSDAWLTQLTAMQPPRPTTNIVNSNGTIIGQRKEFACPLCDRSFGTRHNLKRHFMIHTGEKPFSCSECRKPFREYSTLKKHMVTHLRERYYKCSRCPSNYVDYLEYIEHKRAHDIEDGTYDPDTDDLLLGKNMLDDEDEEEEEAQAQVRAQAHINAEGKNITYEIYDSDEEDNENEDDDDDVDIDSNDSSDYFACRECNHRFTNLKAYKEHMKEHDPSYSLYECYRCKAHYESREMLEKHIVHCMLE